MKTHTINTYSFDELSESAKEKVRDRFRYDGNLYAWHDENVQSLKEFAKWLGAKFDYEVQGGGYGYSWAKIDLSEVYIGWMIENDEDSSYRCLGEIGGNPLLEWLNNYSLTIHKSYPFTGYYMDDDLLDPMREYLAKSDPDDPRTLQDLVNEGCERWVKSYVADWDYQYTDEAIDELIQANEYEFTEDGRLY